MRLIISVFFCVILVISVKAQIRYYPSNYMRVLDAAGDTLVNAYTGGLLSPMYSNIDLNNDGLKDLLIFDKADNTLMTFLAVKKGTTIYHYAPQYIKFFPKTYGWIYLIDYNKDSLPDIFMHAGAYPGENTYMRIYKNVSTKDSIKFKLVKDPVPIKTTSTGSAFYASRVEFPLFLDVDGDGDIDILNFDYVSSNTILYIKNVSVERHPNNKHRLDSIEFNLVSPCWGIFREESFSHAYYSMTEGCDSYLVSKTPLKIDTVTVRSSAHAGSTLFAWDMDGDGDLDLAVGDVGFDSMTVLQNLRINGTSKKKNDSLVINKTDRFFPPNNIKKVSLMDMPLPSPVDIDNDGINDIVIAPLGGNPTFSNASWYYHNEPGSNKIANFNFKQDDFLENTMLDWGGYSKPVFFDYNKDSRPDLLISALSDRNGRQYTHLILYQNMPAKVNGHPYFKLITDDYLNISKDTIYGLAPSIGDLDGDGVPDMVLGNLYGTLMYYKGSYTDNILGFTLKANTLQYKVNGTNQDLKTVGNSAPCITDVDGDGKNDLLIGQQNNRISYYKFYDVENGIPVFTFVTPTFGNILVPGRYISNTIPYVADMNNDGKPDLLVGANDGRVHLYLNIRGTDTLKPSAPIFFNFNANGVLDSSFGFNSAPAAAMLDSDNIPDIVIGNDRGGIYLMASVDEGYKLPTEGIDERNIIPANTIHTEVYPNPATTGDITFSYSGNSVNFNGNLVLTDISGRVLMRQAIKMYTGSGFERINTGKLSSGMYFVALYNSGNVLLNTTRIIIKN